MEVKYQIFVSSTFSDLEEERRKVIEMIMNMGHIPIGMEAFQASDSTQWDYITRRIDECDYYVVIIAERYGSMQDGKSYTQMEYEYATAKGIPVVAFLLAENVRRTLPVDRVDVHLRSQVEAFREMAKQRLSKFWTNADDLSGKVALALHELFRDKPRTGWVRANTVPSSKVMEEISRLSEEKRELQAKIASLQHPTDLIIPADVRHRLQQFQMMFASSYIEGYDVEDEAPSLLETFLSIHKKLSIGSNILSVFQILKADGYPFIKYKPIEIDAIMSEFAANNLIEFTIPNDAQLSKVYFLTAYGKDFSMYAYKYLSQPWEEPKIT
ncbi:DUF4062 domain-containing protein [Rhizobium laguerreae]|uniref:DUF4062 domain-containing protein n=1 Tax=Rhizobium laguerreae TaxID=1076926 RepID=UPI0014411ADD|nr:DUF4062 domain-containing protein [Rhizobium laguerreae]NKM24958.1 DUF4062 domain-containing protein [Rhizobium laguerreae]